MEPEFRDKRDLFRASGITTSGKSVRIIAKWLPLGASVFDVGSGFGMFVSAAARAGYKVTASDLERYTSFEPFVLSDAEKRWTAADTSFDAVTAWQVVEHLQNPRHFFEETHRVLCDNGLLFFSVPNFLKLSNRISFFLSGEFPRYTTNPLHLTAFTRSTIARAWNGLFTLELQGYTDLHKKRASRLFWWFVRFLPSWKMLRGESVFFVLRKKNLASEVSVL